MVPFVNKMETRRLHGNDMKRLIRILRDVPAPTEERYERKQALYRKHTKLDIQDLPRRLRSSSLSFGSSGNLCSLHKGLNAHLINDIWAWLKHEFEGAVGEFLYPLIMHDLLTPEQEWKVRQMEPVLQMWRQDFYLDASPPPGRKPIQRGDKWCYQKDQCLACMMARIASDEDVLFALFASMVGHFNTKSLTIGNADRGAPCWTKTGSKRIRFVKYWLRKTRGGDDTLFKAGDLGMWLKRLTLDWKHKQDSLRYSLSGTTAQNTPTTSARTSEDYPATQCKGKYQGHGRHVSASDAPHTHHTYEPSPLMVDTKVGPIPRPSNLPQLSAAEALGFEMPNVRDKGFTTQYNLQDIHPAYRQDFSQTVPRKFSLSSISSSYPCSASGTLSPNDSISIAATRPTVLHIASQKPFPTNQQKEPNPEARKQDTSLFTTTYKNSVMTPTAPPSNHHLSFPALTQFSTILSYTGGPSKRENHIDPLDNPIYNPIETPEARQEKYQRLLASDTAASNPYAAAVADDDNGNSNVQRDPALPKPKRTSMYFAYWDHKFKGTKFDVVDEELECEEVEQSEKEEGEKESSTTSTKWEDFY
jgi:hypothetical protein